MLNQISIAAVGFSVIALLLLLFQKRSESKNAKILANTLLCNLVAIQILQGLYISDYLLFENLIALIYFLLLGFVGPAFYLYSQYIIHTDKQWRTQDNAHFLSPIVIAIFGYHFPEYFNIAYAIVFLLGGIYMASLVWSLYGLRLRRTLFKTEFLFTASFLSWAIAMVFVAVFSAQTIDYLIPAQVIMLTMAIAAAVHIQLNYPHLLSSLEEIANKNYQSSTISNVDCEEIKSRLEALMADKKIYQDGELSLSSLAEMVSLKSHQLSELMNTQLGMSFSTYLRCQRVKAAETLLTEQPEISVLAIGLDVGFSSQSSFYSAFKEIHAIAPGQYRRQILAK